MLLHSRLVGWLRWAWGMINVLPVVEPRSCGGVAADGGYTSDPRWRLAEIRKRDADVVKRLRRLKAREAMTRPSTGGLPLYFEHDRRIRRGA